MNIRPVLVCLTLREGIMRSMLRLKTTTKLRHGDSHNWKSLIYKTHQPEVFLNIKPMQPNKENYLAVVDFTQK